MLLFDEPSNGLDVYMRAVLIELLDRWPETALVLISMHAHAFAEAISAMVIAFEMLGRR